MGKALTSTCSTCREAPETVAHYLFACPMYSLHPSAVHFRTRPPRTHPRQRPDQSGQLTFPFRLHQRHRKIPQYLRLAGQRATRRQRRDITLLSFLAIPLLWHWLTPLLPTGPDQTQSISSTDDHSPLIPLHYITCLHYTRPPRSPLACTETCSPPRCTYCLL